MQLLSTLARSFKIRGHLVHAKFKILHLVHANFKIFTSPAGHARSQKTGYLLTAQYLCYIIFSEPASELCLLLKLAEIGARR